MFHTKIFHFLSWVVMSKLRLQVVKEVGVVLHLVVVKPPCHLSGYNQDYK